MSRTTVLRAVLDLATVNGRPATERQIASRACLARSTVHYHLTRLAATGAVTLEPSAGRYVPQGSLESAQKRTCAVCGGALEGRRRHAVCCSGACRAEASRRRRAA